MYNLVGFEKGFVCYFLLYCILKTIIVVAILFKLKQNMNTTNVVTSVFDNPIVAYIIKIWWAILVILFLLFVSKIIANIVKNRIIKNADKANKNTEKMAKTIHDIVFYILVIFSFFIGFEILGFNVGLILGWVSFGVGLAFKEILGNMIAGIMILYTKEFKIWDVVEVSADQAYFGRIEEISIRYTVIRTLDLRQVILPNLTLISVPIKTFSSETLVRLSPVFGVHYSSDVWLVIKIITDTVNSFDFVKDKESTKTFVSNFADSCIEIKSIFSFDPKCWMVSDVAIGEINQKMNQEFIKNNINIPYNMLTLNLEGDVAKEITKHI